MMDFLVLALVIGMIFLIFKEMRTNPLQEHINKLNERIKQLELDNEITIQKLNKLENRLEDFVYNMRQLVKKYSQSKGY